MKLVCLYLFTAISILAINGPLTNGAPVSSNAALSTNGQQFNRELNESMEINPLAKRFSFKKFGKFIKHNWEENFDDVAKIWHKVTDPIADQGKETVDAWKDDAKDIARVWNKAKDGTLKGFNAAGDWLDGTSRGFKGKRSEDKLTTWTDSDSTSRGQQDSLFKRWGLDLENYLAADVVGKPIETKDGESNKVSTDSSTNNILEETTSSVNQ